MTGVVVETERLRLRGWTEADIEPWTRLLYADPEVTRYLPASPFSPQERTARFYQYIVDHWARHGYGIWVVTQRTTGAFMGQCGLNHIDELGEVELDYALARDYWGQGYASEAARAATRYGFATLGVPRIVALTFAENIASRRVIQRLGFRYERGVHIFGSDVLLHAATPEQFHRATAPQPAAPAGG